jgi:hypothetical protein
MDLPRALGRLGDGFSIHDVIGRLGESIGWSIRSSRNSSFAKCAHDPPLHRIAFEK